MTTDTLIEEAMGEMHRLGIDNLRAKGAIVRLVEALRRAEAELDAATTQLAKKFKRLEELEKRAEQAEAERDAQHEQVLRLTAERDEARRQLRASEEFLRVVTLERDHAQQVEVPDAFWQRDEARAQVWGLICAGSNMAERRRYFQGLWETLLADGLKRDAQLSELTATRDLLTAENARLQQQLSRPDPVVHETPVDGVVPCCGKKLHDLKDGSRVNEGPLVNCDRMRLLSKVGELSSANLLLTAANARLRKERDAALAMEADTARRSSAEIDSLKAELNEARGEVEDLNRRVEEVCGQRDEARERLCERMRRA